MAEDSAKVEDKEVGVLTEMEEEEGAYEYLNVDVKPLGTRLKEVTIAFAPLGLVAFGGPAAHIGILQNQFVQKLKWMDDERFVELMAVGQGLPGPTSTQMVIATGASHGGVLGGLISFFLWNLPSFIILVTAAMISRATLVGDDAEVLPDYLSGLPAAAISLVFIAAYNLGLKVIYNKASETDPIAKNIMKLKIALATISTCVTILVTGDFLNPRLASAAFPALLILGGTVTYLDSRREGRLEYYYRPPTAEEESENLSILKRINISPYFGLFLIAIWLGTLGTTVILRAIGVIPEFGLAALFEAMFRMGSIIYGGGQVVLPMLLTEVVETGWVTEAQFFQGFSLVQALPGPLFNFSSFLGAIYLGIPGAFVAWLGLFGPGLLLIFAFLPFWQKVRKVSWFKCFLAGVNAAAIGLIVAATAQLWEAAVVDWADVTVFYFTGALIQFYGVYAPFAIFSGGLLGFILSPTVLNYAQKLTQGAVVDCNVTTL